MHKVAYGQVVMNSILCLHFLNILIIALKRTLAQRVVRDEREHERHGVGHEPLRERVRSEAGRKHDYHKSRN